MVTGSHDTTIKFWDLRYGKHYSSFLFITYFVMRILLMASTGFKANICFCGDDSFI